MMMMMMTITGKGIGEKETATATQLRDTLSSSSTPKVARCYFLLQQNWARFAPHSLAC